MYQKRGWKKDAYETKNLRFLMPIPALSRLEIWLFRWRLFDLKGRGHNCLTVKLLIREMLNC